MVLDENLLIEYREPATTPKRRRFIAGKLYTDNILLVHKLSHRYGQLGRVEKEDHDQACAVAFLKALEIYRGLKGQEIQSHRKLFISRLRWEIQTEGRAARVKSRNPKDVSLTDLVVEFNGNSATNAYEEGDVISKFSIGEFTASPSAEGLYSTLEQREVVQDAVTQAWGMFTASEQRAFREAIAVSPSMRTASQRDSGGGLEG